ncbi:Fe-S protein [Vibrio ichthyoenteri ATCC 700023]|uniref:Fe-S protein n=1 Tax=Vibrio ichthyoenteri ATCC 700023 TaxID=870968 RepID=F9S3L9_9VIBR|nr:DUF1289 domain-containing protein [Vibrio ichthyoenteri]EGU37844.1 Fe-S protein [Vibrio ichthyoenteri ATCC 700023]
MEQLEFFSIPSPCVGVCSVDEKGYCHGCMRKREERFNWLSMDAAQKLHVIKLCRQRYRRKKQQESMMECKATKNTESVEVNNPQSDLFDK